MPRTRRRPRRRSKPFNEPAADLFDVLSLELERADRLTAHLAERLDALSEIDDTASTELDALSMIAQHVRERHARIATTAEAMRAAACDVVCEKGRD
jgi:hypothetical protein